MNEDGSDNGRYERVVPENQISKFDRRYASMHDTGMMTKPSTIKVVESVTGRAETYIVQTAREERGDTVFVEIGDESGFYRFALPPKVTAVISSQRDALTARRRSNASKETMRRRMENGKVPGFLKRSGKKGKRGKDRTEEK